MFELLSFFYIYTYIGRILDAPLLDRSNYLCLGLLPGIASSSNLFAVASNYFCLVVGYGACDSVW